MNTIYLECPSCGAMEIRDFLQGKWFLKCSVCLTPFKVEMLSIPIYEKGKTTIVLTAKVSPVRVNPIQFEVAA